MRLVVAVVGKPRDAELRKAIHGYETRAARYWPLEVHEIREEKGSSLTPAVVVSREGKRIQAQLPPRIRTVACHEAGQSRTSRQFASMLQTAQEANRSTAFIIGGAFGRSEEILDASDMRLSLAPWTLSHDLARLVLAEQIYRAGTIVRGEPYHK